MKKTKFKIGDIVCYKGDFLRSCGWYTSVPKNGKVIDIRESLRADNELQVLTVDWAGDVGIMNTLNTNVILDSKKQFDV